MTFSETVQPNGHLSLSLISSLSSPPSPSSPLHDAEGEGRRPVIDPVAEPCASLPLSHVDDHEQGQEGGHLAAECLPDELRVGVGLVPTGCAWGKDSLTVRTTCCISMCGGDGPMVTKRAATGLDFARGMRTPTSRTSC